MPKKLPQTEAPAIASLPVRCHTCGREVAAYDTVQYGSLERGYRRLCSRCYNEEVAGSSGVDFEHLAFDPIELTDVAGSVHRFHFRLHLLGDRVSLEAFELDDGDPGGYQFQLLGDAEADLFDLLGQLVGRIRRALSVRHLKERDPFGLGIADFLVRARISWDREEDGRVPLLVIDGEEISWEQFGRMLMSFEGFQFKLEIHDRSEEI